MAGFASRGHTVRDPGRLVVPEHGRITVDDVTATARPWRTIAFHKPRGIVTTRRDPEGRPTVFDVLGDAGRSLVAVGRLDMASTGLLLLTTDTKLANHLTDPANAIVRRYVVTVRGAFSDQDAARDDAWDRRASAPARSSSESAPLVRRTCIVELVEGKNREIRRMLEALEHPVTKLMRVAFGAIELGTLQPGQWREVARDEITHFSD